MIRFFACFVLFFGESCVKSGDTSNLALMLFVNCTSTRVPMAVEDINEVTAFSFHHSTPNFCNASTSSPLIQTLTHYQVNTVNPLGHKILQLRNFILHDSHLPINKE